MKKHELNLDQFTGTENYYRYYDMLLTDGAHYLAEKAECFWLMDVIWSYVISKKWANREDFLTCTLSANNSVGKVVFDDGNDNLLATQEIPYTDFPLNKIRLFIVWNGNQFVVMLPGEY